METRLKEAESILMKVADMRKLQKEYFKKRDAMVLKYCKEAEREVDNAITKYWDNQLDFEL